MGSVFEYSYLAQYINERDDSARVNHRRMLAVVRHSLGAS